MLAVVAPDRLQVEPAEHTMSIPLSQVVVGAMEVQVELHGVQINLVQVQVVVQADIQVQVAPAAAVLVLIQLT